MGYDGVDGNKVPSIPAARKGGSESRLAIWVRRGKPRGGPTAVARAMMRPSEGQAMSDKGSLSDRVLQNVILTTLRDRYPSSVNHEIIVLIGHANFTLI